MARRLIQVELPVQREWEAIEPLRRTVATCLRVVFRDHGLCDTLAMVAGELLDNAVKFGARRGGQGLTVTVTDEAVSIEVTNPVEPDAKELATLAAEIERIRHAPSPQEAYLDAVRRAALAGGRMGLGLSRIAHEGGCDLSVGVGPGWVLAVRATTRRLRPAAPIAAPPG